MEGGVERLAGSGTEGWHPDMQGFGRQGPGPMGAPDAKPDMHPGTFVCSNCRRRMNVRERAPASAYLCRPCFNWMAADSEN